MLDADVIVLGAGAAGLFCAAEAGRRGRKVLVLDHAERAGRKILISGGGRANFTNLYTQPENFLSENPHFARSALARYSPRDFLALVEQHGIAFHEKALGQLFCDRSAQDIVTLLERECAQTGNVRLQLATSVLAAEHTGTEFLVRTARGDLRAGSLVVATGGLSIPKIGATGIGYEVARHFNLPIVPTRPALVPLTLDAPDLALWSEIAGVSTRVVASTGAGAKRVTFPEKLLFTHRGLSGPAILQISSYLTGPKQQTAELTLDLAPGETVFSPTDARRSPRTAAAAAELLRDHLPARLAERWLARHAPPSWSNSALEGLEMGLHTWQLKPSGTEGYSKAEVTAGGVDTRALDARTMQARAVAGLFFIGEVVDVTGWLGGYNFQWAWASAAAAGRSL